MSLLSLQSHALKNPEAVAALLEARNRMRSMSVLYDKLYRSENLREMSIQEYLTPLIDEIVGVFPNRGMVKIEKRIDLSTPGPQDIKKLSFQGHRIIILKST